MYQEEWNLPKWLKTYSRILLIAGILLVVLLVAGWRLHEKSLANTSDTLTPSQLGQDYTNSGSSSNASSSTNPPAAPASKPQPTTAQQVASWDKKYGYLISNLVQDFQQASTDAKASNLSALNNDCQNLSQDVTIAQGMPSIPDASTEVSWSAALSSDAIGSQDCSDGITNNNVTQIDQAATEFDQGNSSLEAASAAIQKLE